MSEVMRFVDPVAEHGTAAEEYEIEAWLNVAEPLHKQINRRVARAISAPGVFDTWAHVEDDIVHALWSASTAGGIAMSGHVALHDPFLHGGPIIVFISTAGAVPSTPPAAHFVSGYEPDLLPSISPEPMAPSARDAVVRATRRRPRYAEVVPVYEDVD